MTTEYNILKCENNIQISKTVKKTLLLRYILIKLQKE